MELFIRKATLEDVALLSDFSAKTFYDTYAAYNTVEDMENYTSEFFNEQRIAEEIVSGKKQYYLAFTGEVLTGYAALKNWDDDDTEKNIAEVARIYVSEAFKKQNIGKRLIEHSISVCKQEGYKSIQLGVWKENKAAIAFYEKMDFQIVGEHEFLLGQDLQSDWVMGRNL